MAKLLYKDPTFNVRQPKSLVVLLPKELRPFQYPKTRQEKLKLEFYRDVAAKEILSGFVQGLSASDLEERLALALDEFGVKYTFQFEVDSAYSLPSEGRLIDFVINDAGTFIPLEPGATFTHGTPSQKERDRARQQVLNPILQSMGIVPLGTLQYELPLDRPTSVEDARRLLSEMLVSI